MTPTVRSEGVTLPDELRLVPALDTGSEALRDEFWPSLPDGTPHLLFTGLELLRRLASLVPPPRANLTRFHGVFVPSANR